MSRRGFGGLVTACLVLLAGAGCSSAKVPVPHPPSGKKPAAVSGPTQLWSAQSGWIAVPGGASNTPTKAWSLTKRNDNGTALGVYDGMVLDGYNDASDRGFVRRLDPRTGKVRWRTEVDRIPAHSVFDIADAKVIALAHESDGFGPTHHESVIAADTGDLIWSGTLRSDRSPERAGTIVVLPEGANGAKGLDIRTGTIRWHTPRFPRVEDGVLLVDDGSSFGVLDSATGKRRWSHQHVRPPGTTMSQRWQESIEVTGATLFAYGEKKLSAYSVKTGERLWSKSFDGERLGVQVSAVNGDTVLTTTCARIDLCSATALEVSDGRVVWSADGVTSAVIRIGGRTLVLADKKLYDAATGDQLADLPFDGSNARFADGVAYARADANGDDLVACDLTSGRQLWSAPLLAGAEKVFSGVIDRGVLVEDDGDQVQTLTAYRD